MMPATKILRAVLAAVVLTAVVTPASAEQSLTKARELYAAASYEDALAMLNAVGSGDQTRAERQSIGLYRVLCLVALSRTQEAHAAIETMIVQDPFERPVLDDLPPKMRSAFSDARKRMLPAIVQQRYTDGKAAFDRGDFAGAAPAFKQVLDALADPDLAHAAAHAPLSDVRVLASGFHDLSVKAQAPPPPPPSRPAAVVAAAPPPPTRDFRKVYTPQDAEVTPPTVIRQTFPPFPGKVTMASAGMLEVLVDATGAVESVDMVVSVHPQYDRIAVDAARRWQYRPATIDGVPVKYVKRVQVTLTPPR
jgi:TonB family protein